MRNAFIDELVLQATTNERIALIVGDLGYSVVEPFAEKFPERFINVGVAEQNMMGIAAGMASEGYHVFVYSIANFPTFRCAEQIRNDVAYHNLSVCIVSVGGGLGYGNLGYSHHAIQDYGLIRMMPNMLIAAPGDPMEVRACLNYLLLNPQPSYMRLGKAGEKLVHQALPELLKPGQWIPIKNGKSKSLETVIITTGAIMADVNGWIKDPLLEDYSLFSMPLWGSCCKADQLGTVSKKRRVITIEDHLYDCGFGSWMRESVANNSSECEILSLALNNNIAGMVGSQADLNQLGGLSHAELLKLAKCL
jgi:transketolase